MNKILKIIIWSAVVLIVLAIGSLVFFGSYNSRTNSFLCGYAETELSLPANLSGSTIKFNQDVYGSSADLDLSYKCINTYVDSNQGIKLILPSMDAELASSKISSETMFTIYKRIFAECSSLSCMDAGGGGDLLLLKDDHGTLWTINVSNLDSKVYPNLSDYHLEADYYKNGSNLGKIDLTEITLPPSDTKWFK